MITWHRNLNARQGNAWSYNTGDGATQCATVYSASVTIKQPSGKKFNQCVAGLGARGVFAWFKASNVLVNSDVPPMPDCAVQIRFNPKAGQRYFQTNDGTRVDTLRHAWGMADGTCWAII
tara:strand:+ start:335 stop:694 length:360 start_codon:yes stop_codon:yes gene_type:complete